MTSIPTTQDHPPCAVCQHQHPRNESVTISPSGLSCGLGCIPPEIRTLLSLPDPADVTIGAHPTPPTLNSWQDLPSRHFTAELTYPRSKTGLGEEHFLHALDLVGLPAVLRAGPQGAQVDTTLHGRDIRFDFSAYTAAGSGRVNIAALAFIPGQKPEPRGSARLAWNGSPGYPAKEEAHRMAAAFLESKEE